MNNTSVRMISRKNILLVALSFILNSANLLAIEQKGDNDSIRALPSQESQRTNRNALSEDVIQPYGNYRYEEQVGLYRDVTMGDLAQDFATSATAVWSSIKSLNTYAGWAMRNSMGDLSWNIGGGLGGGPQSGFGFPSSGYAGSDPNRLSIHLGPLVVDNIYAGYGLIYNDIYGYNFPNRTSYARDDTIGQMVWVSARTSMILGDSIGITVTPMAYWLPNTGRVGWGIPGPFGAMMMGAGMGGQALAQITWAKAIGRWKLALYDQFTPNGAAYNVGQIAGQGSYQLGDLTPIDRVGRYSLGYGAASAIDNYDPTLSSMRGQDPSWNMSFFNIAGFNAYCAHTETLQSMYYINRFDSWDNDFNKLLATINGGAAVRAGDGSQGVYAVYNFSSADPFNIYIHSASVGAYKMLGPAIRVYGEAGYYWISGIPNGPNGAVGLVGLRQQLGESTYHAFEAGRSVFRPGNLTPGIQDYAQYNVGHQLGSRSVIFGYAGLFSRKQDFVIENDLVFKYAGVTFRGGITDRLFCLASALYEAVENESSSFDSNSRIYITGLDYLLSDTIMGNCFYQYQDTRGTQDFTEHSLFLGLTKQF
jgi:hypothetical protein